MQYGLVVISSASTTFVLERQALITKERVTHEFGLYIYSGTKQGSMVLLFFGTLQLDSCKHVSQAQQQECFSLG